MIDASSKLASLRARTKSRPNDRPVRKSLPALPKRESSPESGSEKKDVLAQLQSQLKDRAKRKEEEAAREIPEETGQESSATVASHEKGAEKATPVSRPAAVVPAARGPGRPSLAMDFPSLVQQGTTIAAELEKGQAETPVGDFFSSLPATRGADWPHAAVIPLSPEARALFLAWATRLPERLFFLQPDLIEFHFTRGGFSLRGDRGGGTVRAADMLEFARGVKRKGLREKECLRMELPAPKGLRNSELYCVNHSGLIAERPDIVSRIASQARVLVVVGRAEDSRDERIEQAVEELAEPMDAILPIVFGAEDSECSWTGEIVSRENCRVLPALKVDASTMKPDPNAGLPDELRPDWNRRLQSGIDLIADRQEKRERDIRKRQKDAERIQGQIDLEMKRTQNASKDLLEELRHHLDEQVGEIQESTKQRNKRQFSPTGEFTHFAGEISGQLTEAHLEKVASSSSRRFGLPGVVVEAIEDEVMERLRSGVHRTVEEIREKLKTYSGTVEKRLTAFHRQPVSVDLPELNEREVWNEIRQYCQIDPKIGIDLPKRDPLRMFMSGSRQFIMPISMILGGPLAKLLLPLFGADRSGLNSNPIFTGTLVGLMIVGLFLFFRNARALDREKMEQSVEKMRETVRTKILREMERVEKEKLEMVLGIVGRVKEECQGNLKTWVDEAISASQQRLGRESAKVKSASVILQKRVREVDQTRKDVEKLKEGFLKSVEESASDT